MGSRNRIETKKIQICTPSFFQLPNPSSQILFLAFLYRRYAEAPFFLVELTFNGENFSSL